MKKRMISLVATLLASAMLLTACGGPSGSWPKKVNVTSDTLYVEKVENLHQIAKPLR